MSLLKKKHLSNFNKIIKEIKYSKFMQETKNFKHHGGSNNIYIHCLKTAYCVYIICLILHLRPTIIKSAVIAALLHDIFGYDWTNAKLDKNQEWKKEKGFNKIKKLHAFNHGIESVNNVSQYVSLTERQKDAIIKHMFPLYPIPPRYIEGWLLTITDKIIATQECLATPFYYLSHFNLQQIKLKFA